MSNATITENWPKDMHEQAFLKRTGVGLKTLESESKVAQLYPTLLDPMDCNLQGSFIHGIFQTRVLEWVAISFSRDLPDPGIKPGSPTLRADAFTV